MGQSKADPRIRRLFACVKPVLALAATAATVSLVSACGGGGAKVAAQGTDHFIRLLRPRPATAIEGRIPSLLKSFPTQDVDEVLRSEVAKVSASVLCQGLNDGLTDVEDWVSVLISSLGSLSPATDFRAKALELQALATEIRESAEAGEEIRVWDTYGRPACIVH